MPAEGSALLLRHPTRQLIGRVETCPTISTSSAGALLSSQAPARRIRRWFIVEVATVALNG